MNRIISAKLRSREIPFDECFQSTACQPIVTNLPHYTSSCGSFVAIHFYVVHRSMFFSLYGFFLDRVFSHSAVFSLSLLYDRYDLHQLSVETRIKRPNQTKRKEWKINWWLWNIINVFCAFLRLVYIENRTVLRIVLFSLCFSNN